MAGEGALQITELWPSFDSKSEGGSSATTYTLPMPSHTLKTPSLPLIFSTGLTLSFTLFTTYKLITDTPNQRIWFIVTSILAIGTLATVAKIKRQRVTIYPDRIEFQSLWDHGTIHRKDIIKIYTGSTIFAGPTTSIRHKDTMRYELPMIRGLTQTLQAWLAEEPTES